MNSKSFSKTSLPTRLYWGENYAPKPPIVKKAIKTALGQAESNLHLYPDSLYTKTKELLANQYNVSLESLLLGNGIEGILPAIFQTFLAPGDEVIIFSPTFTGYQHNIALFKGKAVSIPLELDTKLTSDDIFSYVTKKTKIICIASPNTITGNYHLDNKDIKDILDKFSGMVLVDECYFGIGKFTVLPFQKEYKNLLILRSASKTWGLAGIRFGFCIGDPLTIKRIATYTIDLANDPIAATSFSIIIHILLYHSLLEDSYIKFKSGFSKRLSVLPNVRVYPSYSTFIPIKIANASQQDLAWIISILKTKYGILIKDTSNIGYLLFGVPPKNRWEYVLNALTKIISRA